MAGETTTTIVGNLTADPELRYTQAGLAVASFTVAVNERKFDRTTNDWVDGDPMFMRCSLWRDPAENLAASLTKGTRVIVTGRLKQRTFDDREGNTRTVIELEADEIGPSLRYATAQTTRAVKDAAGGRGQAQPQQDAWATAGASDDTPF